MEKFVRIKISVGLKCHQKKNSILKFNQYTKSEKMSYIIYTDLECLVKRIDRCANSPQKPSTLKIGKHIPYGCSMPTIWDLTI